MTQGSMCSDASFMLDFRTGIVLRQLFWGGTKVFTFKLFSFKILAFCVSFLNIFIYFVNITFFRMYVHCRKNMTILNITTFSPNQRQALLISHLLRRGAFNSIFY